jgi:putative ABC transport system permease protein
MTPDHAPERLYRRLLILLPATLRLEAEEELLQVFRYAYARVSDRAIAVRAVFWLRMLIDLCVASTAEHVHRMYIGAAMANDLKYALRSLLKNPGFATVAILTLTLGVGANTAIFSVVNGVLLRPLPFSQPDSIVQVWSTSPDERHSNHSPADFLDLQRENHTLLKLAAYRQDPITISVNGGDPVGVRGMLVTSDFFDVFGVQPIAGRIFSATTIDRGEPQVVVSESAWAQYLGSDPNAVGRTIRINGVAHTVIGITPRSFGFPERSHFWMLSPKPVPPPSMDVQGDLLANREVQYFLAVGRMKPGVTIEQAQADVSTIAQRLAQQFPKSHGRRGVALQRLRDQIVGDVQRTILLLLAAVGAVLLIACANIASLLLARASGREREFAVRAALGASRGQLVRQLIAESLLLGAAGGVLGIFVGSWSIALLRTLLPAGTPRAEEIGLDATVTIAAMAIALLSALIFGIVPALQASRADASGALHEGDRGSSAGRRHARTRVLVVAEVALTLVLLVSAGLLINSFVRLQRVDPGFAVDQVTLVSAVLPHANYPDRHRQLAFYEALLDNLAARPDVPSAAAVFPSPLNRSQANSTFAIEGRDAADADRPFASFATVSPNYFRTVGIPLIAGRTFSNRDRAPAPPVVIVNAALARRYWTGDDALGRRIRMDDDEGNWMTVVGVVGDSRSLGLDQAPAPMFYLPMSQLTLPFMSIVVRDAAGPAAVASAVRSALRAVDPELPIGTVRPLRDVVNAAVAEPRFRTTLVGAFAVMALVLAAVGVYGLISYGVALRTREIGIRVALGAQPRQVLLPVIREGLLLMLAGITLGAIGSLAATRLLAGLLFEVNATDPLTFLAAALALLATGLIASYVPSRRTLNVDPLTALRAE